MPRVSPLERQVARFPRKPASVRSAAGVIVSTTALIVVLSRMVVHGWRRFAAPYLLTRKRRGGLRRGGRENAANRGQSFSRSLLAD